MPPPERPWEAWEGGPPQALAPRLAYTTGPCMPLMWPVPSVSLRRCARARVELRAHQDARLTASAGMPWARPGEDARNGELQCSWAPPSCGGRLVACCRALLHAG